MSQRWRMTYSTPKKTWSDLTLVLDGWVDSNLPDELSSSGRFHHAQAGVVGTNQRSGTLKSKMSQYFTDTGKIRCVDIMDLVLPYINSKHRTIRMSPSDVTLDDEFDLMDMYNIPVPRQPKQSFRVGDCICIAMTRRPFKKRHTGQKSICRGGRV